MLLVARFLTFMGHECISCKYLSKDVEFRKKEKNKIKLPWRNDLEICIEATVEKGS